MLAVPEPGAQIVPAVAPKKKSHKAKKPKVVAEKPEPPPKKEPKVAPPPPPEPEPSLSKKDRRTKDMMDKLEKLTMDFAMNKDAIFLEKIKEFQASTREILAGTDLEFQDATRSLEEAREKDALDAELFRNYRLECAALMYKHEHDLAITEFKAKRDGMKEKLMAGLEDKKRKMREERENFDVHHVLGEAPIDDQQMGTRKATRANAAKNPEEKKEKRRKIQALPGLVVTVSEDAAASDLNLIRRVRRR
ncbi:hypothetical protein HKX48_004021 [Thoreauomyces humboldtii]|nr:hypothetical protein HKX48_004021 [Thoreauomyces humboldtii]